MTTALARVPEGELRVLGDGESATLVKFTKTGAVRALRTMVRLNPDAGHVYEMNGKQLITAAGYDYLNNALGVTFFMPPTVTGEDGSEHCNPYVIRDKHDNVLRIKIRCVGVGRNATGNWVAQDSTLYYDLVPMMAQDVLSKWKPYGQEPKDWGTLYDCETVPQEVIDDPKIKCLAIPGGYVLACKLSGEMLEVVSGHAHRVRFATRNAETIVKRNILKRFMGLAQLDDNQDGWCTVPVMAWPQADRETIEEVERLVQRAQDGIVDIATPLKIESAQTILDSADGERAALVGESHEDGSAPVDFEPPPIDIQDLKSEIVRRYTKLDQADAKRILGASGFDSLDDVSRSQDTGKLEALFAALQERADDDKQDDADGPRRP